MRRGFDHSLVQPNRREVPDRLPSLRSELTILREPHRGCGAEPAIDVVDECRLVGSLWQSPHLGIIQVRKLDTEGS